MNQFLNNKLHFFHFLIVKISKLKKNFLSNLRFMLSIR